MGKEIVVCVNVYIMVYNGILLSHKNIMPFATTQMDTETIMQSEIHHTKRQIPYNLSYMGS